MQDDGAQQYAVRGAERLGSAGAAPRRASPESEDPQEGGSRVVSSNRSANVAVVVFFGFFFLVKLVASPPKFHLNASGVWFLPRRSPAATRRGGH